MAGVYQIPNKNEKIAELVKLFKLDDVLNSLVVENQAMLLEKVEKSE